MAVPLLLALSICPAILGAQEAIRQSQAKTKREEHRGRRCNLIVSCVKPSVRSREIDGTMIILKDSKLYLATQEFSRNAHFASSGEGHLFAGYYLPYPDSAYEGLVSTISDDPPMLNWIYVDKNTHEVKYGVRIEAQGHITGPFDCTSQDRRMSLEGWEGFVAVEELPGIWALYFDRDDDGLITKVPMGTRVLEVDLCRREKKAPKPSEDITQPHTLDDKMAELKEQRENGDEEEGSEFDKPLDATLAQERSRMQPDQVGSLKYKNGEHHSGDDSSLPCSGFRAGEHDDTDSLPDSLSTATNIASHCLLSGGDGDFDNLTIASSVSGSDEPSIDNFVRNDGRGVYKTPYVEDEDIVA